MVITGYVLEVTQYPYRGTVQEATFRFTTLEDALQAYGSKRSILQAARYKAVHTSFGEGAVIAAMQVFERAYDPEQPRGGRDHIILSISRETDY